MQRAWIVVVAGLAAAACGSSETSHAPDVRKDPEPVPDASRVSISPEVNGQFDAWMAQEATVIADVIEIDATRVPFSSQIATQATTDTFKEGQPLVERKESIDRATGVASLTLTNRSGFTTTLGTLPQVRLGGGRQFIATARLVVRYVPISGMDHPVSISVTATGKARLIEQIEGAPERRVAGSSILLRADIVTGARGYEFRSAEESRR